MGIFFSGLIVGAILAIAVRVTWAYGRGYSHGRLDTAAELEQAIDPRTLQKAGAL